MCATRRKRRTIVSRRGTSHAVIGWLPPYGTIANTAPIIPRMGMKNQNQGRSATNLCELNISAAVAMAVINMKKAIALSVVRNPAPIPKATMRPNSKPQITMPPDNHSTLTFFKTFPFKERWRRLRPRSAAAEGGRLRRVVRAIQMRTRRDSCSQCSDGTCSALRRGTQ